MSEQTSPPADAPEKELPTQRYAGQKVGTLNRWDRVIITGTLSGLTSRRLQRLLPASWTKLAQIFHREIKQRSGECVQRLENIEPNETASHRFFFDRL